MMSTLTAQRLNTQRLNSLPPRGCARNNAEACVTVWSALDTIQRPRLVFQPSRATGHIDHLHGQTALVLKRVLRQRP